MRYLLDSDIIVDFFNRRSNAAALIESIIEYDIAISIINWLEIVYGIEKSTNPQKDWARFTNFLNKFNITIIPFTETEAHHYIEVKISLEKQRRPIADFDLFIAATAIAHDIALVTRNTKHFARIENLKLYIRSPRSGKS